MSTSTQPNNTTILRGLRNNNPLNIRHSSSQWRGRSATQTDASFVQFDNIVYGYRAAIICVRTYISKYKCDTPRKIVSRWAPSSENDTAAYLKQVVTLCGIPADKPISMDDKRAICALLWAMTAVELGFSLGNGVVEYAWRFI